MTPYIITLPCITESSPLLQIMIKEEDRLSAVIAKIDEDVRIVPRGAFIIIPSGQVVSNRSFEGTVNCNIMNTALGNCDFLERNHPALT